MSTRTQIEHHLAVLLGRRLVIARRAADLRGFHFRRLTAVGEGLGTVTSGEFALHIQCPWRIEGPDGIVTGRLDLWEPAEPSDDINWDTWDYEKDPNLQDRRIGEWLGSYDTGTRSSFNNSERLVVEQVAGDEFGGATIVLSGGYRLVIFPSGSIGEDWRLLRAGFPGQEHFVVSGGKADETPDDAD